jgi:hypothetical protein
MCYKKGNRSFVVPYPGPERKNIKKCVQLVVSFQIQVPQLTKNGATSFKRLRNNHPIFSTTEELELLCHVYGSEKKLARVT